MNQQIPPISSQSGFYHNQKYDRILKLNRKGRLKNDDS